MPPATGIARTAADSPPQQDEREVGCWDVTLTEDGVTAANQGRVEIPESVKERLRAEASETGEPVTTSTTLRYQHDLDTRETQSRAPRLSAAALAERARSRNRKMESSTRGTRRYSTS